MMIGVWWFRCVHPSVWPEIDDTTIPGGHRCIVICLLPLRGNNSSTAPPDTGWYWSSNYDWTKRPIIDKKKGE
uniref:Putative secreted protein n=1 Tax=Anopheles marajoara TaxID=58244 RepID=A0A2M4CDI5_9DIPT